VFLYKKYEKNSPNGLVAIFPYGNLYCGTFYGDKVRGDMIDIASINLDWMLNKLNEQNKQSQNNLNITSTRRKVIM
jgi:hypothetical protein